MSAGLGIVTAEPRLKSISYHEISAHEAVPK